MARNEEKAFTLFNKWHTFKQEYHAVSGNRRPLGTGHVDSLPEMEKTRRDVVAKITKAIAAIKNPNLEEMKIREMNDEINKMMKQKYYYELRIRELGGNVPINSRHAFDIEGKELPGAPGYRYFGVAQNLPGVKELFLEREREGEEEEGIEGDQVKKKAKTEKRRTRKDLYACLPPEYFGYTRTMNKRIPNPFLATEDGWEEEDPSLFNLHPPHPEELKLIQVEQEYEAKFFEDYREQHKEWIEQYQEDTQLLELLDTAHIIIPAQIMEEMKQQQQQTSRGGTGSLPSSLLTAHPLSSGFSFTNVAPGNPSKPKEEVVKDPVETIDNSKQALLAKLNLF